MCRLLKSLYGLHQAPRQWFKKLSTTLLENEFVQFKCDYSLFIKIVGSTITIILVYVDDLLICGNDFVAIDDLKQMLSTVFHIKDLGDL